MFTKNEESDRLAWLSWYTRPSYETIYLRRTTTNFDGICIVKAGLEGGEGFASRNFNVGKEMSFNMYMQTPYFESTSITTTSIAISSSLQTTGTVNIIGHKVFPQWETWSTNTITQFEVKLAEGYGFHVDYSVTPGSTINVKTSDSDLICTIGGSRITGYFSAQSTPFDLKSGSNTVYVKSDVGTLYVKYYQRQL